MGDIDLLGADGGRLAAAFASGCVATFAFMLMIGGWLWRLIGKTREDRIAELIKTLDDSEARCREMEIRLTDRISQLETILLFETVGQVRQNAARAIAELHGQIKAKIEAKGKPDE